MFKKNRFEKFNLKKKVFTILLIKKCLDTLRMKQSFMPIIDFIQFLAHNLLSLDFCFTPYVVENANSQWSNCLAMV